MKLRSFGYTLVIILLGMLLYHCSPEKTSDLTKAAIIPKPLFVEASGKNFKLDKNTIIYIPRGEEGLRNVAQRLASQINLASGFTNKIEITEKEPNYGIFLRLDSKGDWGNDEAYVLAIQPKRIVVHAPTAAGAFNGIQSLVQLIPFGHASKAYLIPTGTIRDYPQYAWRGAMLDVARHFFSVEDVKRYIDLISYYKINTLHLHLTDDQGWRIEIKSWPNLALHGGSTEVGGGDGGYYTQEEYKDIIAYASSRFVSIVPEIDLPSHINAALASYGELNGGTIVPEEGRVINQNAILDGKNKPTELYTGIEVGWSTLRVEKEVTFHFVSDVLGELAELTPGPYLHIGGDEAHVTRKQDYITFINRFKDIVNSLDKQMIGWEEIGQANIGSSEIAQFWKVQDYAQMATEKGARVILSPSKKVYLDMKYDSTTKLGLDWAATIEIDSSYMWNPDTYITGIDADHILGVEAPLWSETITTMDELEFLAFPRIVAIAEVAWTPFAKRSWEDFRNRMGNHGPRLKALNVDFYPSPQILWKDHEKMRQN